MRIEVSRTALLLAAGAAVLAVGLVLWAPWDAQSAPLPAGLDAATAKRGETLYRANCAACHGARGEGQPNWKKALPDGSYVAPPHDSSGHTWHHADGLLFGMVKEGGQFGAPPGFKSNMPAYRDVLTDVEILAVLEHIKTFWGPRERQAQRTTSLQAPYPAR